MHWSKFALVRGTPLPFFFYTCKDLGYTMFKPAPWRTTGSTNQFVNPDHTKSCCWVWEGLIVGYSENLHRMLSLKLPSSTRQNKEQKYIPHDGEPNQFPDNLKSEERSNKANKMHPQYAVLFSRTCAYILLLKIPNLDGWHWPSIPETQHPDSSDNVSLETVQKPALCITVHCFTIIGVEVDILRGGGGGGTFNNSSAASAVVWTSADIHFRASVEVVWSATWHFQYMLDLWKQSMCLKHIIWNMQRGSSFRTTF